MRKYHLSYDSKDKRGKILEVLIKNTQIIKVESFCESTLILHFRAKQPDLFEILLRELGNKFYFVLSLVAKIRNPVDNSIEDHVEYVYTPKLNDNLQIEWKELKKKLKK
jgi:hypothetical protein